MQTDKFETQLEAVASKYNKRITSILDKLRLALTEEGYAVSEVDSYNDGESTRWEIFVESPTEDGEDVDISFQIPYDSEEGINFSIDAVSVEGRMIGGCCPFNYTDKVWVSLDSDDEVEQRFALVENLDEMDMVDLIKDFYNAN